MKASKKFLTTLSLFISSVGALLATVPEPDTILFGKVLHRAYGNEHQLTEGTLTWTLRDQDGTDYIYTTELEDINETFSYKMPIPHQALSSGLTVDPSVIPLGAGEETYEFVSIELDGYPAAILWSEVDFLSLFQNTRAATYRIDLSVSFDLLDTDGDGMPDWWERLYGLDWQVPDAGLNSDPDGWTNLEEYLRGSNPLVDDRNPTLQTLSIAAYGESNNGVWLRSIDADSTADEILYTVVTLPSGGYLQLVPDAEELPVTVLTQGATFTQAQLNSGEIAYQHTDPAVTETSFTVTLSDGASTSEESEVLISVFPASPIVADGETEDMPFWWREENLTFEAYWSYRKNVISGDLVESALLYLMGKEYGWTIWDQRADTLPVTLETAGVGSHFILGGSASDVLSGGSSGDIISGGAGENILTGGAGVDLFIVAEAGTETITDFSGEEDVLDLTDLILSQSGVLNDHISASFDGLDSTIGVDFDGDGSGFTDASVLLQGIQLEQDDLHRLWSAGQLLLGDLRGFASITIEGWPDDPIEEGFNVAELFVRRSGPLDQALTVNLDITGSATNGTDYLNLPSTVEFGVNQSVVAITVSPLTDSLSDAEQVVLELASGAGYVSGSLTSGIISIVDARQRFGVIAETEYAVVGDQPGYFRVYRQGPKDSSVELLLSISGTADSGQDYSPISTLLTFGSNVGSRLIPVDALPNGALSVEEASRTLSIGIRPAFGDEYLLSNDAEASMRLLSSMAAFDSWAAESLPVESSSMTNEELQLVKSPRTGLNALLEYALSYGLDLEDGVDASERGQMQLQLIEEDSGIHVEFTRRLNDPNLEYVVECSPDLSTWHSGDAFFEAVPLSESEENAGRVRYRIIGSEEGGQCFIRVRFILSE